jgi:hypothetical protein
MWFKLKTFLTERRNDESIGIRNATYDKSHVLTNVAALENVAEGHNC